MSPPQILYGVVKIITFRNEENGYFVAKVQTVGKSLDQTVIGVSPIIDIGMHLEAKGAWGPSNWGQQFKATEVMATPPKDLEGIVKYLGGGAFDGIGKVYAKKLVEAFGHKVFDIIRNEPEKLNDVPGVGKKRAQAIISSYTETDAKAEIMVFLHQNGLSTSKADKIYKKYGPDTVKKVKKNPYLMTEDIWGMGFKTADVVAQKMGVKVDSEYRIHSGIIHVVRESIGKGSCGIPHENLVEAASLLLGLTYPEVEEGLRREMENKSLIRDIAAGESCYFAPAVYAAEKNIATLLLARSRSKVQIPIDNVALRLLQAEMEIGIPLEDTQQKAVIAALGNVVCVITGGPGTGKTTITKTIITIFEEAGLAVRIATPTGKSARRASEATGKEASTIHRLLEIGKDGKFKRNKENPLECDVLVLDEMSMVDVSLYNNVLNALPEGCRLLLVGDVDQLPSVGPGKVLKDIIDSNAILVVRLTEVFRQAKTSKIIMNAHKVNTGNAPESGWPVGADFGFLDHYLDKDKDKTDEALVALVKSMSSRGFDPIKDVQVLTPMKRGALGCFALNEKLREVLNPNPSVKLLQGIHSLWVGDKVMQIKNNYDKDVFNGDIGIISGISLSDKTVTVSYDERNATYRFNELDELVLAFAITIHKSQGSEFPVVVMPLDTSHFMMLKRNLVYTGITRAKKLMLVIGSKKAAWMAVQNTQVAERYSRLKEWLMVPEVFEVEDI